MTDNPFARRIDAILTDEARLFASTVPYAQHLSREDEALDEAYYVRHRIETVHRIRGTAATDALALCAMAREDYRAARLWGEYIEEEMNHDKLYLADLEQHGIDEAQVVSTPPLAATVDLIRTIEQNVLRIGSLPAVAYSVFAEWNSERASPLAVARAASAFSERHVKGARAHIKIDERDDHYDMMLEVAGRVLRARGYPFEVMEQALRTVGTLLRAYFAELYWVTRDPARSNLPGQARHPHPVSHRTA